MSTEPVEPVPLASEAARVEFHELRSARANTLSE